MGFSINGDSYDLARKLEIAIRRVTAQREVSMDCNKHLEIWNAAVAQPTIAEGICYAALAAANALEALAQRLEAMDFDPQSRDNIVSSLRVRYIPDWRSAAKYADQYRPDVAWEACAAVASAPYGVAVDRGGYRSLAAARYLKRALPQQ